MWAQRRKLLIGIGATVVGISTGSSVLANEHTEDEDEGSSEDETGGGDSEIDLPREFRAQLEGEAETQEVETDASGEATFEVNEDGTEATYELTVENLCNVTQAHVHLGGEGEDGPVVVWLYPEEGMEPELIEGQFSGTLAEGSITADDLVGDWEGADFEDAVGTFEEEGAYVNVHTEQYPDGEIRGQIVPLEE